jgi:hypothetical protein
MQDKPRPLIELAITLIIPALILMKLSGPESLGALRALLLALAFPLFWGVRDLLRRRKLNTLATLGLVSVLLTGGIGLFELDTHWLAVKEAAVPGLIGLVVAGSALTSRPLVRALLYSPALMDVERIQQQLDARGNRAAFDARLRGATWMLSATFFFSCVMNYVLATVIVTSPAGTAAFNEELGRMTLVSYPMIALPAMAMMLAVLYYLMCSIRSLAGLQMAEALKH